MDKKMMAVMQRRGELLARIAVQRGQVAEIGARWEVPLAVADQGVLVARYLRAHPVLIASVAALVVSRRRGVFGMVSGAWLLLRRYRFVAALSKKLYSRYSAHHP